MEGDEYDDGSPAQRIGAILQQVPYLREGETMGNFRNSLTDEQAIPLQAAAFFWWFWLSFKILFVSYIYVQQN